MGSFLFPPTGSHCIGRGLNPEACCNPVVPSPLPLATEDGATVSRHVLCYYTSFHSSDNLAFPWEVIWGDGLSPRNFFKSLLFKVQLKYFLLCTTSLSALGRVAPSVPWHPWTNLFDSIALDLSVYTGYLRYMVCLDLSFLDLVFLNSWRTFW